MADETKRVIDQTTDSSLSAGDFVIVDSQSEGTRKFDLGTELTDIKQDLAELESEAGVTADLKSALLQLASKVAYIDDGGQDYYNDLYDALYPNAQSISCVYTQSRTVYESDSLDSLKSDLVVTAFYSDSTSRTLSPSDYTLSGTLAVGTNTIVVHYGELTATFSVVVTARTLASISALYTQSGTVYDTDTLDSLKSDLVITATYTDSSTAIIPSADYTLSGTLATGTSTITATYENKTTTFSVTVSLVPSGYTAYDYVKYTGTDKSLDATAFNMAIKTKTFEDLNNLIFDFYFSPNKAVTAGTAIFGGQNGTQTYETVVFYGRTDTKRVSAYSQGATVGINDLTNMVIGEVLHVHLDPGTSSPTTLEVDGETVSEAWVNTKVINAPIGIGSQIQIQTSKATIKQFADVGTLKLYDVSTGVIVGKYVPCVRTSDNVIGVFDSVTKEFYTANTVNYATIGHTSCVWTVGNWEVA